MRAMRARPPKVKWTRGCGGLKLRLAGLALCPLLLKHQRQAMNHGVEQTAHHEAAERRKQHQAEIIDHSTSVTCSVWWAVP